LAPSVDGGSDGAALRIERLSDPAAAGAAARPLIIGDSVAGNASAADGSNSGGGGGAADMEAARRTGSGRCGPQARWPWHLSAPSEGGWAGGIPLREEPDTIDDAVGRFGKGRRGWSVLVLRVASEIDAEDPEW
jgi:hypothetical protein